MAPRRALAAWTEDPSSRSGSGGSGGSGEAFHERSAAALRQEDVARRVGALRAWELSGKASSCERFGGVKAVKAKWVPSGVVRPSACVHAASRQAPCCFYLSDFLNPKGQGQEALQGSTISSLSGGVNVRLPRRDTPRDCSIATILR